MELLPNMPVLPSVDGAAPATQSIQPAVGQGQNQNGFSNLLTQLYPMVARLNGDLRARTQSLEAPGQAALEVLSLDESGNIIPAAETILPPVAAPVDPQANKPIQVSLANTGESPLPKLNLPEIKADIEVKQDSITRTNLVLQPAQQDIKALTPEVDPELVKLAQGTGKQEKPVNPFVTAPDSVQFRDSMIKQFFEQARLEARNNQNASMKQFDLSFAQDNANEIKNNVHASTMRAGGVEQINSLYTSVDMHREGSEVRTPSVRVEQNLNNPQWGHELSSRIVWMSKNQMQHANIKINPANLGPIEVKVSVNNEHATVSFVSNHVLVREAIEAALPRLKEAFTENGFQSLNVDVSTSSSSGQEQKSEHVDSPPEFNDTAELQHEQEMLEPGDTTQKVSISNYRVDMFV